jgi:hypothetical protein
VLQNIDRISLERISDRGTNWRARQRAHTLILLDENDVLASNIFHNDLFWQYVAATYKSVFGEMLQIKADSNVILLAQKSTRDLSGSDSMKSIKDNAANLDKAFRSFATNSNEILPEISKLEHPTNPSVRVLTDQYSPANLLLKVKLR